MTDQQKAVGRQAIVWGLLALAVTVYGVLVCASVLRG